MIVNQGSTITPRVLLLGGTSEASELARALAAAKVAAVFSYAGHTAQPLPQPLPTRVGGFGGVAGLCEYLRSQRITHVIDATHPFAAQMSWHAAQACAATGVALLALQRPAWTRQARDRWQSVPDIPAAVAALPREPARIFLAIGRQHIQPFLEAGPHHWWLLRVVDAGPTLPARQGVVVVARGPFTPEGDWALMRDHGITHLIAKNAGGQGGYAKLEAARRLGCTVIMIERPPQPDRPVVETVAGVLHWLGLTEEAHAVVT